MASHSCDVLEGRPQVRLFPSAHISSDREAELRATASLLSMARAVDEFGRSLVKISGGPAGKLSCFTEIPYKLDCGDQLAPEALRPDGVLLVRRGKTTWSAFVEVKVGRSNLEAQQIEKYHRLAKQEGVNALITVSNQPAQADGRPPVPLDGRRLRKIPVTHFSWERLLSEAQLLSRLKEVSDPDQEWMLEEWIRYVNDPASRVIEPPDFGDGWSTVLKSAQTGSLESCPSELRSVVQHWQGYMRKSALRLRARLGVPVRVRLSRKEASDPQLHEARLVEGARAQGTLSGEFRIPNAVGDVGVEIFMHSKTVRYSVSIDAPSAGRQMTRINWLVRQLKKSRLSPGLFVLSDWSVRGLSTQCEAQAAIEDPKKLVQNSAGASIPTAALPRRFTLSLTSKLSRGKGRSSAPVLEAVTKGLEDFYRSSVEGLVRYQEKAPQLESETSETEAT